jgi:hypothetical protein
VKNDDRLKKGILAETKRAHKGDNHFHSLVYREKVSHFHIIFTKTMLPARGIPCLNQ